MNNSQPILDSIDTLFGNVATDRQGTIDAMKLIARRASAYASLETETFDDEDESQTAYYAMSDNQLVAAERAGNEQAGIELAIRHRTVLLKSIGKRIGFGEVAERVADAAFASAREQFDPVNDAYFSCLLRFALTHSADLAA